MGWGGVYYLSWNVDHVVDAPLQMITLYHAPQQGGVGWGVGRGGVHYRSWNVDHVVDAPCSICLVAGDAQVVPGGYQCIHMYIYIYTVNRNGDNRNN